MSTNFIGQVFYGLMICLVIILAGSITGCIKSAAPAASTAASPTFPVSTGRPPATNASQPVPGTGNPPALTIPPVSSPTATPPPASPTAAVPTSAISTAIPVVPTSQPTAANASAPIILVLAPLNVSTVPAGDVAISTVVSFFNLANKTGQTNGAGEGHIIYYMDANPPIIPGQPAITADGTYARSTATSYTWHNVGSGYHYFSAQLVNNDDTPVSPPAMATIYVTVTGSAQSNPGPAATPAP